LAPALPVIRARRGEERRGEEGTQLLLALASREHDPSGAHSRYPRISLARSPSLHPAPTNPRPLAAPSPIPPLHSFVSDHSLYRINLPAVAMAAVTMAASSVAAFAAAPGAAVASSTSFSKFSSVRMAPVRLNRRLSVVAMAQPNDTKKDWQQEVCGSLLFNFACMYCFGSIA
jgi:hypothetical protein